MSEQDEKMAELTQLREKTVSEIERLREELQTEVEPALAADDDAAADMAADIYERGKIISLINNLETKLHSLDRAMNMAEQGTYGICEKCGVQIPEERLKIMPETTHCVRCASEMERGIRRVSMLSMAREAREQRSYANEDDEDNEDYQQEPDDLED
jgi:DnaK suppressor protein